jgi:hypothetical protein
VPQLSTADLLSAQFTSGYLAPPDVRKDAISATSKQAASDVFGERFQGKHEK